jgi:hypothetical protein
MHFSIDMHFCQGQLKSVNLFGEAKSCHETNKRPVCPHHKAMAAGKNLASISKQDCCNNKTFEFELDQDRPFSMDADIVIPPSIDLFILGFIEVFIKATIPAVLKKDDAITTTIPPLISRDIYALLETYLL